jgi:predicted SnoaL-like aldol condensation-catalyzing enzyme
MNNKELALSAITAVFRDRDLSAFDKYFDTNYIQHNPHIPNGLDFLKQFVPTLPADFSYEAGLVTESGDFVMVHGRYENWAGKNMIAVDIFKIKDGKLIEHWDVMQEEVTKENTVSGNSMFPIS